MSIDAIDVMCNMLMHIIESIDIQFIVDSIILSVIKSINTSQPLDVFECKTRAGKGRSSSSVTVHL